MIAAVLGRRPEDPAGRGSRVNVVAIAVLLRGVAMGFAGWRASGSPGPLAVIIGVGLLFLRRRRGSPSSGNGPW